MGHGGYPIPIYLGCYAETPNDDENRLLKGPAGPLNYNTPQKCSEKCFNMGFLFFGVTYGYLQNNNTLLSSIIIIYECY